MADKPNTAPKNIPAADIPHADFVFYEGASAFGFNAWHDWPSRTS